MRLIIKNTERTTKGDIIIYTIVGYLIVIPVTYFITDFVITNI